MAVTIKGFASDWSVPEPAKANLDGLYDKVDPQGRQSVRKGELVVNVKDFGATGDSTTDDTAAIQSAIDSAATNGGVVFFPTAPTGYLVTSALSLHTGQKLLGSGYASTKIIRNADHVILEAVGPAYVPGQGSSTPSMYGVEIEGIGFRSHANGSTSPLVRMRGASACSVRHVRFESYTDGAPLLELLQVWDSKFHNVMFHGGGNSANGQGALRLLTGYEGYRQTKESFFSDLWFESYTGPAIEASRPSGYTDTKTEMLHFSNVKMESHSTTREHMYLEANNVQFSNFYSTFWKTPGPIVKFVGARGIFGELRFFGIPDTGAVAPSAMVEIPTGCMHYSLTVLVSEPQQSTQNVVTLGAPSEPTLDITIHAPYPLINGSQTKTKLLRYSTVKQQVNEATGACQYTWSKAGRPEWTLGNPTNISGTIEQFFLRANSTNFVTFQSDGANPETSGRRMFVNAMLSVGSAWNSPNLIRLGQHAIWVDATGSLRIKNGVPTSDTDGTVVGSPDILTAPNGTKYKLAVGDDGSLSTAAVNP